MLQTILSVAVVQLDIYSDKLLSFPHRPIAHIFALKKQDMSDFSFIPPTSVVTIPGVHASAAFTTKTSEVFKEEHNIAPIIINDRMKYIPWGGDNQMPYNIIDLIESDETMSTCQMFNAEVCYGSGLVYDTELATAQAQVDDFMLDNDLASYFLGVCQDFKHFGFCVSVIILNEDASRIVRIVRKQACYSTTSKLPTRFGTISSRSRASRIVSSSRSVSTRRRTTSSTSLLAWKIVEKCSSPHSMFHPTVRSSTTWSSTKSRRIRRVAIGRRTSSKP